MNPRRLALVVALPMSFFGNALAADLREWTSRDGTAKLTASFYKIEGDKVILLLPNGRTQPVARTLLSAPDREWIEQNSGMAGTASGGTANDAASDEAPRNNAAAPGKIPTALAGKLIDAKGRPFSLNADGVPPKFYLFYYSASWCGPCQAFTPELVKFHRRMKARQASFEVILAPEDRTQEAELAYMKEGRMPWPALALAERHAEGVPRNARKAIPSMVLVDAGGEVLLQVEGQLSTREFLVQAGKILEGKGAETAQN